MYILIVGLVWLILDHNSFSMNGLNKAVSAGLLALSTLNPNTEALASDHVVNEGSGQIVEALAYDQMRKIDDEKTCQLEDAQKQYSADLSDVLGDEGKQKNSEEGQNDEKSKNGIKFGGSAELQTTLYNTLTFLKLSDNPGVHLQGSATLPLGEKTSVTLSEDLYATPEKNNPTCENNFSDIVLSHDINDKISVTGGLELFQFLNQDRGTDLFSTFGVVNYHPSDEFNWNALVFKPICSLDGQKNSKLYMSNIGTYKTDSNKEFLLRLWTDITNKCNTQVSVGFRAPIGDNGSVEFNTIPNETGIIPGGVQGILKYTF